MIKSNEMGELYYSLLQEKFPSSPLAGLPLLNSSCIALVGLPLISCLLNICGIPCYREDTGMKERRNYSRNKG